jgi:VWFA-related protein
LMPVVCLGARKACVEELERIIALGHANGLDDPRIAHSLADLELTEYLTAAAQARLLAHGEGSRTRDVIDILAAVSAFLEPPAADRLARSEPPESERAEILARARAHAIHYIAGLPDFLCTRVTRRFDDQVDLVRTRPEVWARLRLRDTSVGQLSFRSGIESYLDQTSAGGSGTLSAAVATGLSTFGEFGSIVGTLFIGEAITRFSWVRWEYMNGTLTAVFAYSVDSEHSRYFVSHCCSESKGVESAPISIRAAYRGVMYVEPVSGAVFRITRQAVGLPRGFPTQKADTVVDYAMVPIAGVPYVCPIRSVTALETRVRISAVGTRAIRYLNDVRFVRYKRFAASSRLLAGETPESADAAPSTQGDTPPTEETGTWMETPPAEEPATPQVALADAPLTSPAAQPPLTIRTAAQLVEVPVIVSDRRGHAIDGLKSEDFEIYDDGKPQKVQMFAANHRRELAGERAGFENADGRLARQDTDSGKTASSDMRSNFTVILLDQLNTDWADVAYARSEILKFLRQLPPNESAAVYAMDAGTFTVLKDFSRETVDAAKTRFPGQDRYHFARSAYSAPERQPDVLLTDWLNGSRTGSRQYAAKAVFSSSENRTSGSLDVLLAVAKHLSGLPGRKSIVWVSAGFPQGRYEDLVDAGRVFNDLNVAIYCVDAPGLRVALPDATVQVPKDAGGARVLTPEFRTFVSRTNTFAINANQSMMLELSTRTGGRAFLNANDQAGAILAAFKDPQESYRLGFYAQDLDRSGRYHEIRVRLVNGNAARLRYRRGYFDDRSLRSDH